MRFCLAKKKLTCKNCGKIGHEVTRCSYAKKSRRPRNKIRQTQSGDNKDGNLRKYVTVKIFNKTVKFQLYSGSGLSIINLHTWRCLNKPALLRTKKTALSLTGDSINILGEVVLTVTLNGITKKLIAYVLKNRHNLFGTDWIEKFNLWDCPMSTLCRKLESPITNTEKLKQELEQKFPEVFSGGLGKCTKTKAQFRVKDHAQPIFFKKRNVLFAALEQIDEELDRLKKAGILSKEDFSEWAAPTVYVKKKSNQIRVCADFSTGLNKALKDHHYPLPSPEEIFKKLNGGKIISKIDYHTYIFKSRWKRILNSFFVSTEK